jgi:hypothetical protein
LFIALLLFFIGPSLIPEEKASGLDVVSNFSLFNKDKIFVWFAICFPAFTGMTAGVGLSGDLRNPGKSIPLGTMGGTIAGFIIYILVVWKLSISASQADLTTDQLIMARIAYFGAFVIPIGLGASTFSSAIGSLLVAPRTMQALASDRSFPSQRLNGFLSKGVGKTNEPVNATMVTFVVAAIFVVMGNIDMVAQVIAMFFLITYGTLCLISFINHFGSPPSYRPRFKSKWYFSLGGFLMAVWIMFMIDAVYTIASFVLLVSLYLFIENYKKDEKGLVEIFEGALFQFNRRMRVFMQKNRSTVANEEWRPSVICVSPNSFERDKVLELMKWLSHQHGFGTYFHYIEGYYNENTYNESHEILGRLIDMQRGFGSAMYIDTMISPSYTSAIAQVIQTPSISGMENNMVLFEYDKGLCGEIERIASNLHLAKAGQFDVCIFASSNYPIRNRFDIHVWINDSDEKNANLMILLGYIILANPDWSKSQIKIFIASARDSITEKENIRKRIEAGRLPITLANIEIITLSETQSMCDAVTARSNHAGLCIVGLSDEIMQSGVQAYCGKFNNIGDVLFVNASQSIEI